MGKTKLDRVLSIISEGFGLALKLALIILIQLIIVEQICIYSTGHAEYALPLLIVLTTFQIVLAIVINKKRNKKED